MPPTGRDSTRVVTLPICHLVRPAQLPLRAAVASLASTLVDLPGPRAKLSAQNHEARRQSEVTRDVEQEQQDDWGAQEAVRSGVDLQGRNSSAAHARDTPLKHRSCPSERDSRADPRSCFQARNCRNRDSLFLPCSASGRSGWGVHIRFGQ